MKTSFLKIKSMPFEPRSTFFVDLHLVILFIIALVAVGCSFGSKAKKQDPPLPEASVEEQRDSLIISWRIPDIEVDGFILSYGSSKEALTNRLKIEKADLKTAEHVVWGSIYTYHFKDMPQDKVLYYTLESFKGDQFSPPSAVQRAGWSE
jgi:hypothetical protein